MKPLPARDVAAALSRKGFEKRQNDHTYFHFRYRGRDVGVSTMISHGEKEIGIGLIKRMRAQHDSRQTQTSRVSSNAL
jgi:predicted RNA binding protein YcfA (HicA-like mRNA interferase family)